ncbi:MAG: DNA polymerase I [Lachnospiraceae bacterium]|nr:DNA polymerase I [Lachnospiraceae bacterium]
MADKLVLIDGHSILNRAYYGVPPLTNAAGLHINAIYGFLNIMFKILEEEQPDYLTVAFDVSAPTFRHEIYKEYKGTRKQMDPELKEQVPVMKEVLQAMGVLIMEQAGLEADDILGTLAKSAEKEGMEVSLVSGDRDLLQIASDHIKIRIPKTKGGKTEVKDYYAKDVLAEYQVDPLQFIDLKALMGDASDNIPGVPKVGQKTAEKLMVEYGSLEQIYAHVEEISMKAVRESLIEHRDLADLSKVLATINVSAELSYQWEDAKLGNLYTKEAYQKFVELGFRSMLSRFDGAGITEEDAGALVSEEAFIRITGAKEAHAAFEKAVKAGQAGVRVWFVEEKTGGQQLSLFDEVTEEKKRLIAALAVSKDEVYYLDSALLEEGELVGQLRHLYQKNVRMATYAVKELYDVLEIEKGGAEEASSHFFDIQLAAYLLNPLKSDYRTGDIVGLCSGSMLQDYEQRFGKTALETVIKEKEEEFLIYACSEAYAALYCMPELIKRLQEQEMYSLFCDVEMPLSYVLYRMEAEGVRVNPSALHRYGEELAESIACLEEKIYAAVGHEFNINSPKQLGEILFGEMGLPGGKKTKTGYSTSADVLEKLAPEQPVIRDILEYRTLTKLKSTYADGLSVFIKEDDRIHTNFNQTITATGRISSTEPNLQNIPMRMEIGRKIRKVFIPKEGCVFVDADYSQIELRILASLAEDEELIAAYRENQDIHRSTASKVFHVPFEEVTDLQRRNAKAVNFGIVYGISSFGLSQDLSISKKEAQQYIEDYFAMYPAVHAYLESAKEHAKKTGYSVTAFGRRRPIPELKNSNFMQRSFGERVAMNAPIQGTAADVIKIAMIKVYDRLLKEGLEARMILQIHDELLIEAPEKEKEMVMAILEEEMSGAADFPVKLEVDAHWGTDWYEAK